ncbi:MAG: elongator complex protein 3 [Methylocystaceae bacterium]
MIIPIFLPEMGCPGRCVFCDQRRISGQTEIMPPQAVKQIIDQHLATNPCPDQAEVEVAFFGGTFTALPLSAQEKYLEQVKPYIASGKVKQIRISTRPDRITGDDLEILSHYGVWLVELGIQSLDDQVLEQVGRGYGRFQVEKAVKEILDQGLQFGAQLMPGLPGSNAVSDVESARLCAEWGAATARIYPTLVITGTVLEQMYKRGEYVPLSLDQAIEIAADMTECFRRRRIPVIRIGLQASTDLIQPGTIVAGPWHPALGELVKSREWRRRIEKALEGTAAGQSVQIMVPRSKISQAVGQNRMNLLWLQEKLGLNISIDGTPMLQNEDFAVKYRDV